MEPFGLFISSCILCSSSLFLKRIKTRHVILSLGSKHHGNENYRYRGEHAGSVRWYRELVDEHAIAISTRFCTVLLTSTTRAGARYWPRGEADVTMKLSEWTESKHQRRFGNPTRRSTAANRGSACSRRALGNSRGDRITSPGSRSSHACCA